VACAIGETSGSFRRTIVRGCTAAAILLCSYDGAQSGPCTADIDQFEHQIAGGGPNPDSAPSPNSGPTAMQSVDAQLHHQPTPGSVGQAAHVANKDGDAAIERARKADAAGDAASCDQALAEARRLYDVQR
jgi:hypothetical protein